MLGSAALEASRRNHEKQNGVAIGTNGGIDGPDAVTAW
jgi:hypothetical protein